MVQSLKRKVFLNIVQQRSTKTNRAKTSQPNFLQKMGLYRIFRDLKIRASLREGSKLDVETSRRDAKQLTLLVQ